MCNIFFLFCSNKINILVNNINGDYMKKRIILLLSITILLTLTGCNLGNTPTAQVEEYLSKYQRLDKSISTSYTNLTNIITLPSTPTKEEIKEYEKIIKKQYRNLSYEIKNEKINGTKATVEVAITVTDYSNLTKSIDYRSINSHQTLINKLKNTKDKITYTINFKVNKNKNDLWQVEDLSNTNKQKLLGIYS